MPAALYLLALCAAWVLSRGLAERTWWSTVLLYAPQFVYLAGVPLSLPLALWSRDRPALALNACCLAMALGPLMGWCVPIRPPAFHGDAPRVRVLAYNVDVGRRGMDLVIEQIRIFDADVVAFVEVAPKTHTGSLAPAFPDWHFIYHRGILIGSRWPVTVSAVEPLPGADLRTLVHAEVAAPFGGFHVAAVHLETPMRPSFLRNPRTLPDRVADRAQVRRAQFEEMITLLDRVDGPVILAGDFNTPPAGQFYRRVARRLRNAFSEAGWGWGYTYSTRRPLVRIDHIFHSSHWRAARCFVPYSEGSDHLPVAAELVLRRP